MIKIRWQSTAGPYKTPMHGIDFDEETGLTMWEIQGDRVPDHIKGKTWRDYINFLAEDCGTCLRVWVNNTPVWDYEYGLYQVPDL